MLSHTIGLETILQNNLRVLSCKQLSFVAVSWRDHRQKFVYVGNRIKIISFCLLSYCLSANQKVPEYPFILYVKQSYQHTTSIQRREFFLSLFKQAKKTNSCCSIQWITTRNCHRGLLFLYIDSVPGLLGLNRNCFKGEKCSY